MDGLRRAVDGLTALRAGDVMAPSHITVTEHETLAAAWELLARGRSGFLPVTRSLRLVGVVDDHSVLCARSTRTANGQQRLVGDVVRPVRTVDPDAGISTVLGRMVDEELDLLAVVDSVGAPRGFITADALVRLLGRALGFGLRTAAS